MKEMMKSKIMIGFVLFILGVTYVSSPTLRYEESKKEITSHSISQRSYSI